MKTQYIKSTLGCIGAFLILGASFASADTWNATNDFSITNGNPNGTWTYGYMDSGWTSFTAFTQTNGTDGWYKSGADTWIWRNDRGSVQYGVPVGWLSLSPGNGGQDPVLRWTAPTNGWVNVSGQFLAGDTATEEVAIFQGSVRTVGNTLWTNSNSGSFNFDIELTSGDSLGFTINGPYDYGNTPITATITTIPEPTTAALLAGAGALAFTLARRRHRKG